ncbi:MAG: undecaprenyl/decaprenyl-phosphate alpha-N-acetylglucosaminyl 1-phosphate transferase [Proteobacteria bacterium]|nr:undecaprenyl/decaprenyl-phosphate alpha-N-acetylglucosaminyl 1-phosphate transferase [Pseudomonadota bacterium]
MEAYIAVFICALCLSLVLTPLARAAGKRYGAMDIPDQRKVHDQPKPRTGGLAIFMTFVLTMGMGYALVKRPAPFGAQEQYLLAGALACFLVGFVDDVRRLSAWTKLVAQIMAVSIAFYGGNRINLLPFAGVAIPLWLSYCLTVFWFLLFINAINLIDGLDGLAAGICLFTSILMVGISFVRGEFTLVLAFTALSGALLGFLKYNFNPSTIFMGDGGSYFLGFIISGLGVYGSAKGQVGAVFMLPFIGLGVPIFDTLITPIRRFIRGRKMFSPDNGHVHHKLIAMGLTTRRAVLILYILTSVLCLAAIAVVHIRNEMIGLIVIMAALGLLFFSRRSEGGKLSFRGANVWLRDLADVSGISKERRQFLDLQLGIGASRDLDELWEHACRMASSLSMDFVELRIWREPNSLGCDGNQAVYTWADEGFNTNTDICRQGLLKVELPLLGPDAKELGLIWFIKDIGKTPISPHTFVRLEQFRRSVEELLVRLALAEPTSGGGTGTEK